MYLHYCLGRFGTDKLVWKTVEILIKLLGVSFYQKMGFIYGILVSGLGLIAYSFASRGRLTAADPGGSLGSDFLVAF